MAQVFMVEGWKLSGLVDYSGNSLPAQLLSVGWRQESGSSFTGVTSVEDDEHLGRRLRLSLGSSTGAGDGRYYYRNVTRGATPKLVVGCAVVDHWSDTQFTGLGAVFNATAIPTPERPTAGLSISSSGMRLFADRGYLDSGSLTHANSGFVPGFPNWVELVLDISNQQVELWVNNLLVRRVDWSQAPSGDGLWSVGFARFASTSGWAGDPAVIHVGSLYAADERLGRCQVITRFPTDDAAVEFERANGDSNASQVADRDGPDGDETYISSSLTGASDFYSSSDGVPLTNERIHAVAVTVSGRREDVGDRAIAPVLRRGNTESQGDPLQLAITHYLGTQAVFSVDPSTGQNWTLNGLQQHELGVRLVD